ncbi:MAG: HD domain-containing phosphohydrolase [Longimicrobiales bacterium]
MGLELSPPTGTLAALIEEARLAERNGAWDTALARYREAFSRLVPDGDAATAAELLRSVGRVYFERGEYELAEEQFEASLAIAEACGLASAAAAALNCLAVVAQWRGDLAEAESRYERASALAARLGEVGLAAKIEQNLGMLANVRGDVRTAITRYRSALECYQQLGDDLAAARALNNIGMAHVDVGEWAAAEDCFAEAFDLAERQHDTETIGAIETNRAELYLARQQYQRARESCDRAFEVFARLESKRWIAEVHKLYGILYRESGKHGLATHHFERGVALTQQSQNLLLEAEVLREWALVHLLLQENPQALQRLNRAHGLFGELQARRELLDLDHRLDDLEGTFLRVVRQWAETIESKDRYTAGHCERVANYTCMLAEAVGVTGRDLTWMRMGGYLHDVGKIVVPGEILNKPGKLTDEEWAIMKSHTTAGDEIVAELGFPWDIRPIVRWHHERWDGGGYPDGIAGEEIPLYARILCVADVFDALTTARSYRPALPHDEALAIMERDSGKMFEPGLFALFQSLITDPQQARNPAPRLSLHRPESTTAAA